MPIRDIALPKKDFMDTDEFDAAVEYAMMNGINPDEYITGLLVRKTLQDYLQKDEGTDERCSDS